MENNPIFNDAPNKQHSLASGIFHTAFNRTVPFRVVILVRESIRSTAMAAFCYFFDTHSHALTHTQTYNNRF